MSKGRNRLQYLRPVYMGKSGSHLNRIRFTSGMDRPCFYTRKSRSDPVLVRYPIYFPIASIVVECRSDPLLYSVNCEIRSRTGTDGKKRLIFCKHRSDRMPALK